MHRKCQFTSIYDLLPLTSPQIIGPQVYLAKEAPVYHTGLYVDIGCWCILWCLIITMGLYLKYLNRQKKARRVALGLPGDLLDMSIMDTVEANNYRIALTERLRREGFDETRLYEDAFDDMTDFQ